MIEISKIENIRLFFWSTSDGVGSYQINKHSKENFKFHI